MSLLGIYSPPILPSKKIHASIPRLVINIHTSFIRNKQTLETTQIPQMVMEKQTVLYLYNRLLLRKRKELVIQAAAWMNLKSI